MNALKNEASRSLTDLSLPALPPFFIFFFPGKHVDLPAVM